MSQPSLHPFIIRAKKATYVAGSVKDKSSRPSSHDLSFHEGDWTYRDSYFGGTDFIGQETVWFKGEPVWSMIYYGYIRNRPRSPARQFRLVWPPRPFQHIVRRLNRTLQRPRNHHCSGHNRLRTGLHGRLNKAIATQKTAVSSMGTYSGG
jgi:Domain of unknown function (DUF5680)